MKALVFFSLSLNLVSVFDSLEKTGDDNNNKVRIRRIWSLFDGSFGW